MSELVNNLRREELRDVTKALVKSLRGTSNYFINRKKYKMSDSPNDYISQIKSRKRELISLVDKYDKTLSLYCIQYMDKQKFSSRFKQSLRRIKK